MFINLLGFVSCSRYAFLYAGSNEFINYRHQADIFTIYNLLLSRGFTQENIALYAYDDIATDPENPYQGQIFHSLDHKTNVYPGSSAINVKGNYVTADAFNNAIKYLPTTSDDYVFIYYDDHGGPGILGTPYGNQIYWDDLTRDFNKAESSHLYKKCLFLIEACYSGSVAKHFTATNLATVTAASADQESYATVYDSTVGTYLTNEFTNNFIEIIQSQPTITVGELINGLQSSTTMSSVCFFGDESIKNIKLEEFIGTPQNTALFIKKSDTTDKVTQREAAARTLASLSIHDKANIRAMARMHTLKRKIDSERLATVLEMIAQIVEPEKFNEVMIDTKSEATTVYLDVLRVFVKRFGEVNPDDFHQFNVLKALASLHTKTEIVQAIYTII